MYLKYVIFIITVPVFSQSFFKLDLIFISTLIYNNFDNYYLDNYMISVLIIEDEEPIRRVLKKIFSVNSPLNQI